ncbi:hypothetical protein EWM62_13920 [Mucilaginibacter terrigena]|uniref:Uncharacterized protein n=1 Tax=Mucilaginibacter terrigena TaxID=2492395 RepID=A0A4Q5LL21_9SPHI|nr:hypothetical protein [Mucilaginibacter terrigena]RYU89419.1 hypothetical protein EWM62_13920 [Mucilaginibacter terrigena]
MADKSKEFHEFFQETYALFEKTTQYAKYLETLGDKVEITYINELRSVLFHLYSYLDKACENDDKKFEENYYGAREHLYRSYYDVFSLICVILIKKFKNYSDDFSHSVIHAVYPAYFSKIMVELAEVQKLISKIHSSKQLNEQLSSEIDPQLTTAEKIIKNEKITTVLMNWDVELLAYTGLFVEHQQERILEEKRLEALELEKERAHELELAKIGKEDNRFKVNIWVTIAIAIFSVIATLAFTYFYIVPHEAELNKPATSSPASKAK